MLEALEEHNDDVDADVILPEVARIVADYDKKIANVSDQFPNKTDALRAQKLLNEAREDAIRGVQTTYGALIAAADNLTTNEVVRLKDVLLSPRTTSSVTTSDADSSTQTGPESSSGEVSSDDADQDLHPHCIRRREARTGPLHRIPSPGSQLSGRPRIILKISQSSRPRGRSHHGRPQAASARRTASTSRARTSSCSSRPPRLCAPSRYSCFMPLFCAASDWWAPGRALAALSRPRGCSQCPSSFTSHSENGLAGTPASSGRAQAAAPLLPSSGRAASIFLRHSSSI